MSLDKRDAATRAVDKLVEQGLLDKFQKYNIAQVIREEYADLESLLSRHEALKAAMRQKAKEWREQAKGVIGSAVTGECCHATCAAELEALAEDSK